VIFPAEAAGERPVLDFTELASHSLSDYLRDYGAGQDHHGNVPGNLTTLSCRLGMSEADILLRRTPAVPPPQGIHTSPLLAATVRAESTHYPVPGGHADLYDRRNRRGPLGGLPLGCPGKAQEICTNSITNSD
jgi:hypothetical protein